MKAAGCFAAAVVLFGYPDLAGACSCGPDDPPPLAALSTSDAVFAGIVTDVEYPPTDWFVGADGIRRRHISSMDLVKYSIDVTYAWKGVMTDKVSVYSMRGSESCGYEFQKGEHYLIYARVLDSLQLYDEPRSPILPPVLYAGACTRTGPLDDALADRVKLPPPFPLRASTPFPSLTLTSVLSDLQNEQGRVRRRAARALVHIGERMDLVVPALVKLLRSQDPDDRCAAAHTLARLGSPAKGAAPALRKALEDESDCVRNEAQHALKQIGVAPQALMK